MKSKVAIPERIYIGGVWYRVLLEDELENDDGIELLGQHDYGRLALHLSRATAPELLPFVLLHEVLHACVTVCGADSHQEEHLVAGLSHVLLQVLRENPNLVRYLLSPTEEREERGATSSIRRIDGGSLPAAVSDGEETGGPS